MVYTCNLDNNRQLYIENQGVQTVIALSSTSPNQQQSQRSSFETGNWILPPSLFRTSSGLVVRIEAQQGQYFIQVQASGMSILTTAPSLIDAEVLPLQRATAQTAPKFQPMPPMTPMAPMQMRMGNMEMQMGKPLGRRFCSQCGHGVEPSDRFCPQCGHQLIFVEG